MKNKLLLIALSLMFVVGISIPTHNVLADTCATQGQGCWHKDPADTTYGGVYCSTGAVTVLYGGNAGRTASGTSGQVYDELRYSSTCQANWGRGTVYATTAYTYQLGVRVIPDSPYAGYYATEYAQGVVYGSQYYTNMVNGQVYVTGYAGIGPSACNGDQDSFGDYTGFSSYCTPLYNPLTSYRG